MKNPYIIIIANKQSDIILITFLADSSVYKFVCVLANKVREIPTAVNTVRLTDSNIVFLVSNVFLLLY